MLPLKFKIYLDKTCCIANIVNLIYSLIKKFIFLINTNYLCTLTQNLTASYIEWWQLWYSLYARHICKYFNHSAQSTAQYMNYVLSPINILYESGLMHHKMLIENHSGSWVFTQTSLTVMYLVITRKLITWSQFVKADVSR